MTDSFVTSSTCDRLLSDFSVSDSSVIFSSIVSHWMVIYIQILSEKFINLVTLYTLTLISRRIADLVLTVFFKFAVSL